MRNNEQEGSVQTAIKFSDKAMLVEAAGTVNTGDAGGDKTAPTDTWI